MFCRNCGKEVGTGDNFCAGCGQRVENVSQNVNASVENTAQSQNNDPGIRITDDQSASARFRIRCEYCLCEFEYGIKNLGYRIWYQHGFVYCPKCKRPLRHKMEYRI